MRRLLLLLAIAPGCFTDAPPVDDAVAEESSDEAGDSESSSEGSSSSGGALSWEDAYGPCEVDEDCPLVPGDDGEFGENPRCVQGTCAIRCADASGGGYPACPGYLLTERDGPEADPIACQDGYCTIQFDPYGEGYGCPDGMGTSETMTVPDLDCVWEP